MDLMQEHVAKVCRDRNQELEDIALAIMAAGISIDNFRINIVGYVWQQDGYSNCFSINYF